MSLHLLDGFFYAVKGHQAIADIAVPNPCNIARVRGQRGASGYGRVFGLHRIYHNQIYGICKRGGATGLHFTRTPAKHPSINPKIQPKKETQCNIKKLGSSDLMVSEICLGSMTWGTQNTPEEGHAQIDMALDYGVNIIDTAEVYPVNPMSAETQGSTERIIGQWIQKSGKRDKVMLATKVAGAGYAPVREGSPISRANIQAAMDASLRSLCTDYVDLYQLHWPNQRRLYVQAKLGL